MAADQAPITQAITQAAVKAAKAEELAMAEAMGDDSFGARSEPTSMGPILGSPTLKQPTFDWCSIDKYS